jgi:hypothetical protein
VIIVTFVIRLNPGATKYIPASIMIARGIPRMETTLRVHNIAMICLQTPGEASFTAENNNDYVGNAAESKVVYA